jgi:ATP-dependent DNA ligase
MLPFGPPLQPMLGTLAEALPEGPDWVFEPKWDGFRVLVFRDGDALDLRSRDDKPLLRYFPELDAPLRAALPEVAVADGEIVVATDGALDFEAMQLRLHPAASRIKKLSAELPAAIVVWDLLASGAEDLRERPFRERRERLVAELRTNATVQLTPSTADRARAEDWFARFEGAGLDGVMAKRLSDPYLPNKRALVKVKHVRTLDCVVFGFRWHKSAEGEEVGSLLLGLHAADGDLWPIGVASSFTKTERKRLREVLLPLQVPHAPYEGEAMKSRWNADRDLSFVALRPERVVEVSTTQHSARRLRHPAKVVRWRDDKRPEDCTVDQLAITPAPELGELLGRDR